MKTAPSRQPEGTREDSRPFRGAETVDEVITPSEVAAMLKIHVKTVYRLAEAGAIPGNRIGRHWRFSRKTILRLLSGTRNQRMGTDNSRRAAARVQPS
jgi:excisionase family DNA binding protein